MAVLICTPRILPPELEETARRRSIEINPDNAQILRTVQRVIPGARRGQKRLVVVVGNRWPKSKNVLSVQFLDSPSASLRARLLSHMNAWNKTANIRFEETAGTGEVRIARFDEPAAIAGYWSWVGTEVLAISEDEPTMNLEGFTMKTAESEFRRVVRHEAGHTLGFDHEHMRSELVARIDRKKAIVYFKKTQDWTEEEVKEQVLTPLKAKSIMGTTEADPLSIMCYEIPGKITKDGEPILGGTDINANDYAFAGKIYPKSSTPPSHAEAVVNAESSGDLVALLPGGSGPERLPRFAAEGGETLSIFVMSPVGDASSDTATATQLPQPRVAQVLASYAGAQVIGTLQLTGGKSNPTAWGRIIKTHERIKNYTNREKGDLPDDGELRQFGKDLFDTLIHGDVLRLYDEARSRQQNRKLDVILTSMISWVAEKPWEFAYDTKRRSFLATEDVNLVRNVVTVIPSYITPPRLGSLRILVVAAQPVGLGRLSVEQETDVIRRGFQPLIDAGLAVVDVLPRATPGRLHGKLSTCQFDVVHSIGHGAFDEELEEGALYFEDDRGNALPMGARSLREIFCKRGVNLVFLNACQSGSGGRKDFNMGLAQSLVEHGMPAVVANQYSVLDMSATSFAQHFYWSLSQGMSIGKSASEARIAVNYSSGVDIIDWAVPVLFTRAPDLAICATPPTRSSTPATSVSRIERRAIRNHAVRVAVWDIDSAFPAIKSTLDTLNAAQTVFGFEVVSLSIPIRAWDLETESPDGKPYLWSERLVRQVKRTLPELQVDMLICITAHWMRDDEIWNLFTSWSADIPVTIFSCAGLELEPAGHTTDQVLANVLVSLLAGYRGDIGSHKNGSKTCPLYYNESREIAHIAGRQRFDGPCLDALKKKLPHEELLALTALLDVFK